MRKHNKTFHIRFADREYEKLCNLSEKTGLPKSTYIRFMIAGQVPKEHPPPDYYAMIRLLYRIGNLLNQIAARAHTTGHIGSKRLDETIIVFRQALLDIQDAVLLPEAMDTKVILQRAQDLEALEEQTKSTSKPMIWDIANNKRESEE